ncbi:MAG TPA: hypothetical protein VGK14_00870 [Novimethylophilus sp.]|jgi:hypothetical protein|uniref:hypothetical protein n=1 Tax=Novimethylophilus sp. TaxID=2137426 RepID=UPI002F3FFF65
MAQQINLINPELRPKFELLTAALMAKVVAAFALLLGIYAWSLSHEATKLAQQREEWAHRTQDEQSKLLQVAQRNPVRTVSQVLQAEIKMTAEKVSEREKVFAALKSGSIRSRAGFSGLLHGFARQSVNGLWLTGIMANAAGDQMRISGKALSPDLIPQYLMRLSGDQALHGRSFSTLEVTQPKQDTAKDPKLAASSQVAGQIEFIISAEKPAESGARKPPPPAPGANS